jgi:hypothetical protein
VAPEDDSKKDEKDKDTKDEVDETTPEPEETPEQEIKDDLHGEPVTVDHLTALRDHYDRRLAELAADRTKDAEEKEALRQQIEKTQETLNTMLQREEEKEKTKDSSSTIVVPPSHLDPPQQNKDTEEPEPEVNSPADKKKRMRFY